jgi:biopolymer transport protein ExbB
MFGLVACLVLPGAANAWWNDDWILRKPVTVDTGATGGNITEPFGGPGATGHTPVLVRLHAGNFKFDAGKPDGSDLRVIAADDKTPLKFEIEKYDSLLGEAFVWVDVPDLKPGAQTSFYLYYGNAKAQATGATGPAFDADTVLVYHFAEHGVPPRDSSAFANNGQTLGQSTDGSLIGPGLKLDGATPVTIPGSPSLAWTDGGALTWSAWIKPTALSPNAVIYSRRDGANGLVIGLDNGSPFVEVTRGGISQRTASTPSVAANSWHHLAVTAVNGAVTLALDGTPVGSVNAALPVLASVATIGTDQAAPGGGNQGVSPIAAAAQQVIPPAPAAATAFVGEMDELEISKVVRSAGFIRLAALEQGPDGAKALKLGQDEETSSWSGGYFGVILHSVTMDGWVVIAILMLMAVLSWVVMVEKARYLSRLEKANERFRDAFSKVAADLTVLDHGSSGTVDPSFPKHSSLYRVYHIAAEEMKHRAAMRTGRPRPLSAEAIAAIRASLDSGQVREMQRMNRMMVLLTIAISGGPFLGLLGTVVGVMITFAAIAASGDVNVNAIAPGIAAALVATVAGLGVAIPALFGYNWLLTRIKNASADLQVFVDELLTRTAEAYRRKADLHAEQAAPHAAAGVAE